MESINEQPISEQQAGDTRIVGRERLAVAASFTTMFTMGVTISLLGPSLAGLAQQAGISLAQAGILFTLFSAGSILATLMFAWLVDRPVRHPLMVIGALGLAAALWYAPHCRTPAQVGAGIGLVGLTLSTVGVAPNAIIAAIYRERSARAFNALHLLGGAGAFLGPLLVGGAIRQTGSYTLAFYVTAGLALGLALLWAVARPPRPLPAPTKRNGARYHLPLGPLALLIGVMLLYMGIEQAFGGWIFTYARVASLAGVTAASLANALFWLAILFSRLLMMQVLRRARMATVLMAGAIVGLVGIGVVLLASLAPVLLWPGVVLVGIGFGPLFPTTMAAGTQMAPHRAGLISSVFVAFGSVGSMVLPWAGGALMPHIGIVGSMASNLVVLTALLACLIAFNHLPQAAR
jgi:fucose permease